MNARDRARLEEIHSREWLKSSLDHKLSEVRDALKPKTPLRKCATPHCITKVPAPRTHCRIHSRLA